MLSATFRQASRPRPEMVRVDPANRLLWRMNPRRLDIEADDGAQLAVRAGLNPSDQLILNPPVGVVDGMRVTTTPEAKSVAGAHAAAG